jgi:uncharacterized membrane protein
MSKWREATAVFSIGAAGYMLLELLWRQRTHWTMGLAGGTCLSILYNLYNRYRSVHFLHKCVTGSLLITVVELFCGLWVNRMQRWNVWDYSALPFNLFGQICLQYSLYWAVLSGVLVKFCERLKFFLMRRR